MSDLVAARDGLEMRRTWSYGGESFVLTWKGDGVRPPLCKNFGPWQDNSCVLDHEESADALVQMYGLRILCDGAERYVVAHLDELGLKTVARFYCDGTVAFLRRAEPGLIYAALAAIEAHRRHLE